MKHIRKTLQIITALTLLASLLGAASLPMFSGYSKMQPLLTRMAAEDPAQMVMVIVQKVAPDKDPESAVVRLGGEVTKDLQIINAFAAKLSAKAAMQLANEPGVRFVSLDAPVDRSAITTSGPVTTNTYLDTLRVGDVWNMGLNGTGIGVAVIDSGITNNKDIGLKYQSTFNSRSTSVQDYYGHGTHVAGILAGNGNQSAGKFKGIAPGLKLISLKVCDETGAAFESDVVAAMQWVYQNKAQYNIRVVNLSLNSTMEMSYNLSPFDAAAEILWFNGVVVIASAGNSSTLSPINLIKAAPANDPFIITVGASDELTTSAFSDDTIASYSAFGVTGDGFLKPDIIAPGSNIISLLSSQSSWKTTAPDRVVDTYYFRLSGTSMAAPMVTGAVALLLQSEPNLTPDQVKFRLMNATSRSLSGKVGRTTVSWPYLDVYASVTGTTTASANTGLTASQLLWTGSQPLTWGSVAWNSVAWNSVAWNSVAWNSVAWNSVAWNSLYWGP